MSDSSYVGDYFYVNEESIKHRHELERQKGNPFITGSMAGASFLQQPYGGLSHVSYGWPFQKSKETNCSKNVVKGESKQ